MVVNTTPPEATESFARRSARSAACTGGWRNKSRQRAKVPNSWSSRSLRSVRTTMVGFLHLWREDHPAGIEGHGQALARALRVPNHADAAVPLAAAGHGVGIVAALVLGEALRLAPT